MAFPGKEPIRIEIIINYQTADQNGQIAEPV